MENQPILIDRKGSICILTLNRPDVLNTFTEKLAMQLQQELSSIAEDPSVRAVILTGSGRGFCAGQDLKEILPSPENPNPKTNGEIVRGHYNPVIQAIRNLPKPVICAVNGVAAGAGANLAFSCDFCVATTASSFIQSFSKIGLISDSGGTWLLPRLVGMAKATELMMLGDKVAAEEARQLGLIGKVVEADELMSTCMELAEKLAKMPTQSFAYTKQLLNCSYDNHLEAQLEMEAVYQDKAGKSQDYKEGVAAFIEKRKPVFTGE